MVDVNIYNFCSDKKFFFDIKLQDEELYAKTDNP